MSKPIGRITKCMACGNTELHDDQPHSLCVECRIDDAYWSLNHWTARIWDDFPPEEHDEIRRHLNADLNNLRALRTANRTGKAAIQQGPWR